MPEVTRQDRIAVITVVIVVVLISMFFFRPLLSSIESPSNPTYPEYTGRAVILAPANTVLWNVSGPGKIASLIPFVVNKTATLTGSWESNNLTLLKILPYTINKTIINEYMSSIQRNISEYSDQGNFDMQLLTGKYYLIIGPVNNTQVQIVVKNTIEATYC